MLQDKIYNYFDRNESLHVLFIFDHTGLIEEELNSVQWPDGYRYIKPKGGWFTIKYKLDHDWANERVVMLFNNLSPATFRQEFPLMDVLKANLEYHEQDYAAFMQQYHIKAEFATYISRHVTELQSDKMLTLLQQHYADNTFNLDLANRAFISMYLDKVPKTIADWTTIIIRLILLGDEAEEKKRTAFFSKLDKNIDAKNALTSHLEKTFSAGLQTNTSERINLIVQKMKYNAITQSLPVNQADLYKHLRINDSMALQDINNIMEQATANPKRSQQFRNVMRQLASDVREQEIVNIYGVDADYWTVSPSMALALLAAVIDNKLATEPQAALDRIGNLLMKCTDQSAITDVVDFATFTAKYYEGYKAIKSLKLNTPDEYVNRYCTEFYLLDQYYRCAVNRFYAVDDTVQVYATLERAKDALDIHYHKFANRLNLEWIDCLQAKGGFKRISLTRQQDFYDKYVKPMSCKVVVVVSDALRYEVAAQLTERLAALRHPTKFEAALAMMPTETCYCKPSLLPHTALHFVDAGKMQVDGEFLTDTISREKSLQNFRPKSVCRTFKTMTEDNSRDENREVCKNDVVYILHDTIDESSHGRKPSKTITDSCETAVNELAQLVKSLHSSWNATHVVITSDHGFLFNDIKFEEKDMQRIDTDEPIENKSRFYLTRSDAAVSNIFKFPLNVVSGMDNEGIHVAVPVGTNRIYAKGGDYVFCHGGAALQELIIPIIVSHRQDEETRGSVEAMLLEQNLRMTSSRVKFTILQTQAVSGEFKERNIVCALYDGDNMVSPQTAVSLNRSDAMLDARKFPIELTLSKPTSASVLQLRVYDITDPLNPLFTKNIINNTLIQMDEF